MTQTPRPPRARVRRVLDATPLVVMPMKLKLRAFTECFDRGSGVPALVLQAELSEDRLLVSIGGREPIVLSGEADRDAHGAFILLDAQEHLVGSEHALRLEEEARDADQSHAALSYLELT